MLVLHTTDGSLVAAGRCVSYCEAPTITILCADGTQRHWRADLTDILPMSPQQVALIIPNAIKATAPAEDEDE